MSRPFINSGVSQTRHFQLLGARPAVRLAARVEGLASMRIRFQAEYGIQQSPVRITCGRGKSKDIKDQAKDLDRSK